MQLDILLFAIIAGIILFRLYMTLGEEGGEEEGDEVERPTRKDNVVSLEKERQRPDRAAERSFQNLPATMRKAALGILKFDPEFNQEDFLDGAKQAFEMITNAFVTGNLFVLEKLLSPDIFDAFKQSITERQDQNYSLENTIVKIESVEIIDIQLRSYIADIRVKIISEQVPVLRDEAGEIVEGNPDQIDQVIDTWTFERDLKSPNPNWKLIATTEA